jgi:cbb3-type cytochrome oxidase subunit 1
MQAGLSTQNAPSIWVVAPHYLIGTIGFIIASVFSVIHYEEFLNYHLTPHLIAITHIMILGWVSLVIFGALYQLIPVVMEVKIFSEKLAMATLAILIIGLILLVAGFFKFEFAATSLLDTGGTLVIIAILLFSYNTLKSAANSKVKSISRQYIITAGLYLVLNVLFGLFIILNMSFHWVKVPHTQFLTGHLAIGLAGWFMMLIIGVAAKLMPMFLIVHKLKENYLRWGYYLLNTGILAVFFMVWFNGIPKIFYYFSFLLVLTGMILFLMFNYDVYKQRMRKKLDSGMKPTAISFIIFIFSLISFTILYFTDLNLMLGPGKLEIISGFLLIFGFFTGIILGQTYKTLPFIVWLYHYQKLVGKQKTPLPGEMFNEKFVTVHTWTFIVSVVLFVTGILLNIDLIVLAATITVLLTSLVYGANISKMIFHKNKIKQ